MIKQKNNLIKKMMILALCISCLLLILAGCGESKKQVKVLILPHFEIGEMTGDDPGEAQYYYEQYLTDSQMYELGNGDVLYYNPKNGVAMSITGMGKTNASSNMTCVLSDNRFDFSKAYVICTGCCGGAIENSTLGDVCLATAACDYELGYVADIRDMEGENTPSTWFYLSDTDSSNHFVLNADLIDQAYNVTKDVVLQTTDASKAVMANDFPGEEWANREPKVLKGTTVSGDQYWKGQYSHDRAVYITEYYQCPDPFVSTEMEDVSLLCVANKYGLLDRTIVIRGIVNMDVFLGNDTATSLWLGESDGSIDGFDFGSDTIDVFNPAMENIADVGIPIINGILDGSIAVK